MPIDRMIRFHKLFIFIFIAFHSVELFAQQGIWQRLSVEDGLSDPNITSFVKSEDGEMYIGSSAGITRYDGFNFYPVKFPKELQINPYVNSLLAEGSTVYAGMRNGIVKIDIYTHKISVIKHSLANFGGAHQMYINKDHSALFAATHQGIICVDLRESGFKVYDTLLFVGRPNLKLDKDNSITVWWQHKFMQLDGHNRELLFTDSEILDAQWWEKENCWIACKTDGLYTFNQENRILTKLKPMITFDKLDSQKLYTDGGSNIWIRTKNGFGKLESKKDVDIQVFNKENGNNNTITSNTAQAFYQDDYGTEWVGGDGSGISFLTKSGDKISFVSDNSVGVEHFWYFKPLIETQEIICGTTQGIIHGKFHENKLSDPKLIKPKTKDRFSVTSIVDLNKKEWIISVYNSGLWILNKETYEFKPLDHINKKLITPYIYGIQSISDGRLIILTRNNAFILSKKTMELSRFNQAVFHNYSIYTCMEDRLSNVFLGGGYGFQIFNKQLKQEKYFQNQPDSSNGLCSNVIMGFNETSDGTIYLATMGGGLCSYDRSTDSFNSINLVTDPVNVFGILNLDDDTLLLTTSNGMCLYTIKTEQSVMINRSNLLPFNDFNQSAYYQDNERIIAGGEHGALFIEKEHLKEVFNHQDEIVVWDKFAPVKTIKLQAGENNLSLRLSLKSLMRSENAVFQYRIIELDSEWHSLLEGHNNLIYNYLPPGDYHLEIQVDDPTGFLKVSRKEIQISVLPYFYQTLLFKLVILILLTMGIILIVRYFTFLRLRFRLNRLDAERKIMLERSRISRELHDNLGSQLTYLISGLETTEVLLKRKNIEKTEKNLDSLQNAARESMQQLRDSIWALNPGKMTLQSFVNQFDQWQKRLSEPFENLQFIFTADHISDFDIDPINGLNLFRIMQEAIHNILKHAQASVIEIKIQDLPHELIIGIVDNGIGFDTALSDGNGLTSMKQRAKSLNAAFTIQSQKEKGTIIRIVLNKNTLKGE